MTRINPCDAKAVADKMLEDWDDACNELGITHFLLWGTCLGFYREGGYIKDDHDMDVGVDCSDERRAVLMERLRGLGFTIDPPVYIEHVHRGGVYLDIYPLERIRARIAPFVGSFDTITYNGRAYKAPHPVEGYLEHFYGEDWRIPLLAERRVYASGCWDLFHVGHLNFLRRAKELGDILVVGVITDDFMRSYKGEPAIPFEQRRQVVSALECVDYVVAYRSATDYEPIKRYGITIRAVGPEYGQFPDQRASRRELEERGIKHVVIPRTPDISTAKIMEVCCEKMVASGDSPGVAVGELPGP